MSVNATKDQLGSDQRMIVTVTLSAINVFLERARPVQTHAATVNAPPARFPDL